MTNSIDLLTYTYSTLIPQIQSLNPPKKGRINGLIEENSLIELISKEPTLQAISTEAANSLAKIIELFHARYFLLACETDTLTLPQGLKAIGSLTFLKSQIQDLDTASSVEDFVSNLDLTISASNLSDLFEWAKLIKSIPAELGSHESFIPILSIRLKSLIWSKMTPEDMAGHIELASTLVQCTAYKDLELNDLIDIILDHCFDFIENSNDFYGIEKLQGNEVQIDKEGTKQLLGILKCVPLANKELKIRFEELEKVYESTAPVIQPVEIRMNEVRGLAEFRLTDKIFYNHNDPIRRLQTVVRGGTLLSGTPVALKMYITENQEELNKCNAEVDTLKLLSNQKSCFLQFYGSVRLQDTLYIVTEQCKKTLYDELAERKISGKHFTNEERIAIIEELLEGFTFMAYNKKYHQDIKPENIMYSLQGNLKIIDFNVSIQTDDIESSTSPGQTYLIRGTKPWMSPEVLKVFLDNRILNQNKTVTHKLSKSDIFSLGLVFLSLYVYDELNGLNQAENNKALHALVENRVQPDCIKNLLKKMLSINPAERPSFRRALGEVPSKTTKPV